MFPHQTEANIRQSRKPLLTRGVTDEDSWANMERNKGMKFSPHITHPESFSESGCANILFRCLVPVAQKHHILREQQLANTQGITVQRKVSADLFGQMYGGGGG